MLSNFLCLSVFNIYFFLIDFEFYAILIRRRFTDIITELLLPVYSDPKLHDFFFKA